MADSNRPAAAADDDAKKVMHALRTFSFNERKLWMDRRIQAYLKPRGLSSVKPETRMILRELVAESMVDGISESGTLMLREGGGGGGVGDDDDVKQQQVMTLTMRGLFNVSAPLSQHVAKSRQPHELYSNIISRPWYDAEYVSRCFLQQHHQTTPSYRINNYFARVLTKPGAYVDPSNLDNSTALLRPEIELDGFICAGEYQPNLLKWPTDSRVRKTDRPGDGRTEAHRPISLGSHPFSWRGRFPDTKAGRDSLWSMYDAYPDEREQLIGRSRNQRNALWKRVISQPDPPEFYPSHEVAGSTDYIIYMLGGNHLDSIRILLAQSLLKANKLNAGNKLRVLLMVNSRMRETLRTVREWGETDDRDRQKQVFYTGSGDPTDDSSVGWDRGDYFLNTTSRTLFERDPKSDKWLIKSTSVLLGSGPPRTAYPLREEFYMDTRQQLLYRRGDPEQPSLWHFEREHQNEYVWQDFGFQRAAAAATSDSRHELLKARQVYRKYTDTEQLAEFFREYKTQRGETPDQVEARFFNLTTRELLELREEMNRDYELFRFFRDVKELNQPNIAIVRTNFNRFLKQSLASRTKFRKLSSDWFIYQSQPERFRVWITPGPPGREVGKAGDYYWNLDIDSAAAAAAATPSLYQKANNGRQWVPVEGGTAIIGQGLPPTRNTDNVENVEWYVDSNSYQLYRIRGGGSGSGNSSAGKKWVWENVLYVQFQNDGAGVGNEALLRRQRFNEPDRMGEWKNVNHWTTTMSFRQENMVLPANRQLSDSWEQWEVWELKRSGRGGEVEEDRKNHLFLHAETVARMFPLNDFRARGAYRPTVTSAPSADLFSIGDGRRVIDEEHDAKDLERGGGIGGGGGGGRPRYLQYSARSGLYSSHGSKFDSWQAHKNGSLYMWDPLRVKMKDFSTTTSTSTSAANDDDDTGEKEAFVREYLERRGGGNRIKNRASVEAAYDEYVKARNGGEERFKRLHVGRANRHAQLGGALPMQDFQNLSQSQYANVPGFRQNSDVAINPFGGGRRGGGGYNNDDAAAAAEFRRQNKWPLSRFIRADDDANDEAAAAAAASSLRGKNNATLTLELNYIPESDGDGDGADDGAGAGAGFDFEMDQVSDFTVQSALEMSANLVSHMIVPPLLSDRLVFGNDETTLGEYLTDVNYSFEIDPDNARRTLLNVMRGQFGNSPADREFDAIPYTTSDEFMTALEKMTHLVALHGGRALDSNTTTTIDMTMIRSWAAFMNRPASEQISITRFNSDGTSVAIQQPTAVSEVGFLSTNPSPTKSVNDVMWRALRDTAEDWIMIPIKSQTSLAEIKKLNDLTLASVNIVPVIVLQHPRQWPPTAAAAAAGGDDDGDDDHQNPFSGYQEIMHMGNSARNLTPGEVDEFRRTYGEWVKTKKHVADSTIPVLDNGGSRPIYMVEVERSVAIEDTVWVAMITTNQSLDADAAAAAAAATPPPPSSWICSGTDDGSRELLSAGGGGGVDAEDFVDSDYPREFRRQISGYNEKYPLSRFAAAVSSGAPPPILNPGQTIQLDPGKLTLINAADNSQPPPTTAGIASLSLGDGDQDQETLRKFNETRDTILPSNPMYLTRLHARQGSPMVQQLSMNGTLFSEFDNADDSPYKQLLFRGCIATPASRASVRENLKAALSVLGERTLSDAMQSLRRRIERRFKELIVLRTDSQLPVDISGVRNWVGLTKFSFSPRFQVNQVWSIGGGSGSRNMVAVRPSNDSGKWDQEPVVQIETMCALGRGARDWSSPMSILMSAVSQTTRRWAMAPVMLLNGGGGGGDAAGLTSHASQILTCYLRHAFLPALVLPRDTSPESRGWQRFPLRNRNRFRELFQNVKMTRNSTKQQRLEIRDKFQQWVREFSADGDGVVVDWTLLPDYDLVVFQVESGGGGGDDDDDGDDAGVVAASYPAIETSVWAVLDKSI